MDIALLGHMGRDHALADRLEGHRLHVLGQWENPGLLDHATVSNGSISTIGSITDTKTIADWVEHVQPDMFLTNFDDALAAGVVDAVQDRLPNILIPCPTKEAARIEWDKFYLRDIIDEIGPKYNPVNFMAASLRSALEAIDYFETFGQEIALKPRNLAGGKGVKVMGKHFDTFDEARAYARQVLTDPTQSGIEVQEKLAGHEFTLQIFTDGRTLVRPPETYDYPYREDGDTGPGTGGMGVFSVKPSEHLPFVDQTDYDEAMNLMKRVLQELDERDTPYKGILYPTFFKTKQGLKIVEINARGGDPELINIAELLDDDIDLGAALTSIAMGELRHNDIRYKDLASAMIYLVAPEYGYEIGPQYEYELDTDIADSLGCNVRFAASTRISPRRYKTVGSSRSVGISALASTPWKAREHIISAINQGLGNSTPLAFRRDVGDKTYIERLVV